MDASASLKTDVDTNPNEVYGFFVIENSAFTTPIKQRNRSVIKYTKLPDYDFDSKGSWSNQGYMLQPRLRRIITLDGPVLKTTRSLKSDLAVPPKKTTASLKNRKIVTISEDDENKLRPKCSKELRKSSIIKTSQKAILTDFKDEKQSSQRITSRLTSSSKYTKETKPSAKMNSALNRKEFNVVKPSNTGKSTYNYNILSRTSTRSRHNKDKETFRNNKSGNSSSITSISKNLTTPSESDKNVSIIKTKLLENLLSNVSLKKTVEKSRAMKSPLPQNKNKVTILKEIQSKNKPITIIHVPLDEKYQNQNIIESKIVNNKMHPLKKDSGILDSITGREEIIYRDVKIGTDPPPRTVNETTEMENFKLDNIYKCEKTTDVQTDLIKETFDRLDIPNVTLTKDKSQIKEKHHTISLPNLEIPTVKISPNKEEKSNERNFCKSSSYIISRATLTYTTRQKINFHVVGNNYNTCSNQSTSPLAYPINVVSVLKKEIKNQELSDIIAENETRKKKDKSDVEYTNCVNELKSLNCSCVFNSNKLIKPSDIISTIRVNNGLLKNDYICEQFQKELNFIDSFFESLQYLESYSLSDECFRNNKIDSLVRNPVLFESGFDVKNAEYDDFLSKLENGANVDETETMASKSLCLLNLLIRDEQRRAKNLLFVLKMRENALKDFTKSQILWLENKKKHENTDISTLKKKQRGALLKLQYECGEMQRMRKALVTLSEKRKIALMKTKKNIELKMKNNVDVEQIILGKKKLKRCATMDRTTVPLKCFDLSSSGCEDSTTSRNNSSDTALLAPEASAAITSCMSAEKCIQTSDSVLEERAKDTVADNFVVVDGGYLNILFHNLSLPQMFSSGKQYEVNEDALKNIVHSSNTQYCKLNWSDMVEKLMEQIRNRELDRSSSPSTARSLVEEFDLYYKGFVDVEKSPVDLSDKEIENGNSSIVAEIKNTLAQPSGFQIEESTKRGKDSASTMTNDSFDDVLKKPYNASSVDKSCVCDSLETKTESKEKELETVSNVVVPAVVATADPIAAEDTWLPAKTSTTSTISESSSNSSPLCPSRSSMSSLTSPVHVEAEELRRQQLAIEREIKELEQQQSRLLVVREIPDKPPPPYTPPAETRIPKLPRMFMADANTLGNLKQHITDADSDFEPTDAFDMFVRDFCQESLEDLEQSDKPWDACNLLPQKPQIDTDELVKQTTLGLTEILAGVAPPVVSGVSGRRLDHIDDILFAEWRRCEPEWTALHTDEAIVKNQIFESIFQKILTDTVDEYKRTVQNNSPME